MAREIKILIPDEYEDDNLQIKVYSKNDKIVEYRLDILKYDKSKTQLNRADFVKSKIDEYDKAYSLMEVGLDHNQKIPLLFQYVSHKK